MRHSQKRSTIITTNAPFSDWGNILFNTTIAAAIVYRVSKTCLRTLMLCSPVLADRAF